MDTSQPTHAKFAGPLGALNIYNLSVTKSTSIPALESGAPSPLAVMAITKSNAPRHTLAPRMVPCAQHQIVYNALRTFQVAVDGSVRAINGTARDFCLHLGGDNKSVTTTECDGKVHTRWNMVTVASEGAGTATATDSQAQGIIRSAVDLSVCLAATFTNDTTCPHTKLDPASNPPCRSMVSCMLHALPYLKQHKERMLLCALAFVPLVLRWYMVRCVLMQCSV